MPKGPDGAEWGDAIMGELSNLLKKYLNEKHKSILHLAKACSMDRSTAYKILKGTRNPSSMDQIRRMSAFLQLTPREEEKMIEAYEIDRDGRVSVYRRKEVEKFLCEPFIRISQDFELPAHVEDSLNTVRMLNNEFEANSAVYDAILSAAQKGQGKIAVFATDADESFSVFIRSLQHTYPDLQIDYILMINYDSYEYMHEDSGYLNLAKLKCTLQIVGNTNTRVYYQYGTVNSGMNEVPYFTNAVITSDTVVMLKNGHAKALCIQDPDIAREYQKMFEETKDNSKELFAFANSIEIMFQYLTDLSFHNIRARLIYEMAPCLFHSVTEQLLQEKTIQEVPERDTLIQKILAYVEVNGEVIRSGKVPMIHCFEGYRDFMESGLLRDLPSHMYTPFTMKERIELLERYIDSIGDTDLHVLKKAIGPIQNGLYVFLYDQALMFQFLNSEGRLILMALNEFTFYDAFEDYLKALIQKTELFYTKEELTEKLNTLLNEYKEKYI